MAKRKLSIKEQRQLEFAVAVDEYLSEISSMLQNKNRRYGDSVLQPIRVFSKSSVDSGIAVRLDDKLSRIRAAEADDLEDAEKDLIGYLVMRRIARKRAP